MVTMALAWVLRRPNVASCIIGASRPEQVHQNAEAAGIELSEDTLEAIDEALEGVTVTGPRLANFVAEGVKHR
jgi:aryl-alcohol dehydrogenase-like predicted oxidoreductase